MKNLIKHASKISGLTSISRILGLIRDQIFAATLGASFFADCFIIAFRIPNLFRDMFAEGALSNAFVPTLTQTIEKNSWAKGKQLIARLMGLVFLIVGATVLIGMFFAEPLVSIIAPGFKTIPGKLEQTGQLTQILFPFLLFVSLASVMMGIHHVHRSFTIPAIAPLIFNACCILGGAVIYLYEFQGAYAVIAWSIGTLVGGLSQCLVQMPSLIQRKRLPWPSFKKIWSDPHLRSMLALMVPAIIALSGAQINILINTILASLIEEGAPSWLNYGFRLMQLPIGVFAVAIGVVALAQTSKDAAQKDMDGLRAHTQHAMLLNWTLTLPCAVGLWIMAEPIVCLLFERGAFTTFDTQMTALAVKWYAFGIPFYSGVKIKGPIFFTQNLARIPMIASLVGITINIVFNVLMYQRLGHWGLALGTSIGMLVNFLLLSWYFRHKLNAMISMAHITSILKILLATVLMGCIAFNLSLYFDSKFTNLFWQKLIHVFAVVGIAMAFYALTLKLMGIWNLFFHANKGPNSTSA